MARRPANLAVEGETRAEAARATLAAFPGYTFGLADETFDTDDTAARRRVTTDEDGNARLRRRSCPNATPTSLPLDAQTSSSASLDTNGRIRSSAA